MAATQGAPTGLPAPWSLPATGPLRLVALTDSTGFTDDRGPQLPDEPTLYVNVAGRRIAEALDREVSVHLIAEPGHSVRVAQRSVSKARHVMFELLLGADAVIVGLGGFDHVPLGVPAPVEALVPFLRPTSLRRRVRRGLSAAYPWLVRAGGARFTRTPPREFDRLFDLLLTQIRGLTRGAPGVVVGPTSQRADHYARRDPRFREREARQLDLAAAHGYAAFSAWDHVLPCLDRLNVDGIHWPADVHATVGRQAAGALLPQLTGQRPIPGPPGA